MNSSRCRTRHGAIGGTCWLRFAGVGLIALLFFWGETCVSTAQTKTSLTEIIKLLSAGDNQKALAAADHALTSAPDDCRLLTVKGLALQGLGRRQPSLQSFKTALKQCPDYLPALEAAAQLEYAQRGRGTISLLKRILTLQPENVTAHAMLASIYRSENDCADALPQFGQSTELFATRPELLRGYGSCLAVSGNYSAALAIYKQVLASKPDDSVRYDVAFLEWKEGASVDALTTLGPLLKTGSYEPALALGAKLSERAGNTLQAVKLLRAAILLEPDNADNYLDFAELASTHRSFQVGIDMINAGLKRLPDAARLYVARGALEVQLSKNREAIADFERAHRLDPKLSLAADAMGIMQSQLHNDKQSLALFRSAVKQSPRDPLLQYLLAEQLSNETSADDPNMKEAIAAARASVKLDPTYQPAHDLLARLYVRTGQPNLAIEQAKLALTRDPNDEAALYQEIMAMRRSGNTAELRALTDRLSAARRSNALKDRSVVRYQLQDNISH